MKYWIEAELTLKHLFMVKTQPWFIHNIKSHRELLMHTFTPTCNIRIGGIAIIENMGLKKKCIATHYRSPRHYNFTDLIFS